MTVRICNIFSKVFLSPPTNIAIFPVVALWHPPLTGPSSGIAPFAATNFPSLFTSDSSVVLISNQILFFERLFITPSFASITSEQTSGDGKQVIIRSTSSVNSFVVFATLAPLSIKLFEIFSSKSLTVKSNLLLNKLPASFPPTLPSPIKPIFITTSLIIMNIKNLMIYFFLKNVFNKSRAKI